ncbi:Hypothetical protein Cul131001_0110 [Corynebacterium ulcerans]|nr:Hypothetical protein Cul131001_0110 [Corynebacterium ulcerans]
MRGLSLRLQSQPFIEVLLLAVVSSEPTNFSKAKVAAASVAAFH